MKKRWLWLSGVVLVLAAIATIALVWGGALRGFLTGEASFQGRPTSYWREELRKEDLTNYRFSEAKGPFVYAKEATPVLLQCARDPDPHVRSVAINHLSETRDRSSDVLSLLRESLHDPDTEVRRHAAFALGSWQEEASAAAPDLAALVRDPNENVSSAGGISLWYVDANAAADALGWRPIPEDEWGFTGLMPPKVEVKKSPPGPMGKPAVHVYSADAYGMDYLLSVGEFPEGFKFPASDEKRLDLIHTLLLERIRGGTVTDERPVELQGRTGRQFVLTVHDKGTFYARTFVEGRRWYLVAGGSFIGVVNEHSVKFFLDSFRLPESS